MAEISRLPRGKKPDRLRGKLRTTKTTRDPISSYRLVHKDFQVSWAIQIHSFPRNINDGQM